MHVQSERGRRIGRQIEDLETEVICGTDNEQELIDQIEVLQDKYYSIEGCYFRSIHAN